MIKLPKIANKKKKVVGRGYGSGKGGHTVGRGQKGQKSRRNLGILFEGYKMKKSLIKRLPLSRGKGKFKAGKKSIVVNLEYLNTFKAGETVNIESLIKNGIVEKNDAIKFGVKILGNGAITKKLNVALPISHSAAKKIEKVGGKVSENV